MENPNTSNLKKKMRMGNFFILLESGGRQSWGVWQLWEAVRHTGSFFLSAQSSGTSGFHPQSCLVVAYGHGAPAIMVTFEAGSR